MQFDDDRPSTSRDDSSPSWHGAGFGARDGMRSNLFGCAAAALLGALFSGFSTADFIEHLDRQLHSVHCSFIPGMGQSTMESGCRTVMLSPYSSLFRTSMWGGLPISLLAFAVFAYLIYRALDFALRKPATQLETKFLLVATMLPLGMSVIYGSISAFKLDALCKLCAGVYVSSLLCAVFAFLAHRRAGPGPSFGSVGSLYTRWFGEGVLYVAALVVAFMVAHPTSPKSHDGCGALVKNDDPAGIMFSLEGSKYGAPSIAVIDPLCPTCKAFDERLEASGLVPELNLRAVLFPLDASCNWMLKQSLHPGACAVSEAILCDKEEARAILSFAFLHQEELRESAKKNDSVVRERLTAAFPRVKQCLGTAGARNRVNKSLRWAVANALPVLTPQLFIGDRRVCDEDTDLGLEFTITSMLKRHGARASR
jgi:uncharacterized membrane protein